VVLLKFRGLWVKQSEKKTPFYSQAKMTESAFFAMSRTAHRTTHRLMAFQSLCCQNFSLKICEHFLQREISRHNTELWARISTFCLI